jgi:hypothetical protein
MGGLPLRTMVERLHAIVVGAVVSRATGSGCVIITIGNYCKTSACHYIWPRSFTSYLLKLRVGYY